MKTYLGGQQEARGFQSRDVRDGMVTGALAFGRPASSLTSCIMILQKGIAMLEYHSDANCTGTSSRTVEGP